MHYPSGKTHLSAIIADPIAHVRAADLAGVVPRLTRLGNLKGLIVTIPHKETVARLCHELGPNGRLTGAADTIRIRPGERLIGEMFDGLGLLAAARGRTVVGGRPMAELQIDAQMAFIGEPPQRAQA